MDTRLRTGAAYYPEHWPEATWPEQARRMKELGFTTMRVGEFAWALMEPEEGRFDFAWLDRAIDLLARHGIETIIGTPTAAPPAWLTRKYPEVRLVDQRGVRLPHGGRRHVCPVSYRYRELSERIVRAIGEHYAANDAVVAYQTDNEFGCHAAACYCPECRAAFSDHLRERYGSIARLCEEWDANFWSVRPESFEDLPPEDWYLWMDMQHPAMKLEYKRFMSRQWCDYHSFQRTVLHRTSPGKPVFHNMMGLDAGFDHFEMARESDFVGLDVYPPGSRGDPKTGTLIYHPVWLSMIHHVTRSLRRDVPYHVVESPLAAVNWTPVCSLPRPGQPELWAHTAFAHGADTYLTFRWQAVRSGSEKHHCAVLMHDLRMDGPNVDIARRIASAAATLSKHLAGTRVRARVAFAHSYENLWQASLQHKTRRMNTGWEAWAPWCEALMDLGVTYDVVDLNRPEEWAEDYHLVIVPYQQNLSDASADALRRYVARGGTLLATCCTGWANEHGRMRDAPQPAPLSDVFGIIVQTHDPLEESRTNEVRLAGNAKGGAALAVSHWCDIIAPRGAEVVGTFGTDFYAGSPAVTANAYEKGRAWYVGTVPGDELAAALLRRLCAECGVPTHDLPRRVELVTRRSDDGREFDYYLNHNDREVTFPPVRPGRNLLVKQGKAGKSGNLALAPYGAAVIAAV